MFNEIIRGLLRLALILPLFGSQPAVAQPVNEDFILTASDSAAGDAFGQSVAVSGTTAIVGAVGDDGFIGAAYIFETAAGQQLLKLTGSDAAAGDAFGQSVFISGTIAIVGAPFHDGGAGVDSGAAYVFDSTTGQQLGKLTASDAVASGNFGWSVSISGTTAIVGAIQDGDGGYGAAYVFDVVTGQQLFKLNASDDSSARGFGTSVALSGNTAIIGAPGWSSSFPTLSFGAAYIFDTSTGQQLLRLMASDAEPDDIFGFAVAISGDTAIVGSVDNNGLTGSAYIFDAITGDQLLKLTAPNALAGDAFGQSVGISGTTAIVGARVEINTGQVSGAAYAFDTTTGERLLKLIPSGPPTSGLFGNSVAISGSTAVIGAFGNDFAGLDAGSAYVFIRPPEITSQPQSIIVSPGETAVLSVSVNNPGSREFRWRRNGVVLSNGGNITGARSPTLQIIAQPSDEAVYDCVISNPVSIVTDAVVIAIRPDPDACTADLNGDGEVNFFDVSVFLSAYSAGCP